MACTGGEMVPDKFYENCRTLVSQVQEAAVARKMGHPDAEKLAGKLLNGWVDFFLEHGEGPPPFHAEIATASWQAAMRAIGYGIRRMVDQAPGQDEGETAILPLYVLVQPEVFKSVDGLLSAWNAASVPAVLGPEGTASFTAWLETCNIRPMLALRDLLVADFPHSAERLAQVLETVRQEWGPVRRADPVGQPALASAAIPLLTRRLAEERAWWGERLFH
ncbi:MAG: hypothetical protein GX442_19370 [Candidatus Riflebacteria bacterium]|nr:hypothetical protein [Candidatus Riflebacteria bacterium]